MFAYGKKKEKVTPVLQITRMAFLLPSDLPQGL
jgi:hypothetical protein